MQLQRLAQTQSTQAVFNKSNGNVGDYLSKVRKLGRRSEVESFMAGGPSPEDLMYRLVRLGALRDGKDPLHPKTSFRGKRLGHCHNGGLRTHMSEIIITGLLGTARKELGLYACIT